LHTRYKFGVLFVKEGQTKEEEWFSNEHDSTALDHFLSIIGQRVPLVGYKGWTGGLDRKTGDSGGYTYVNTWQEEHSIAYHVSTLLPSNQGDKQQIQRKRHIGNDIVCLVFVEGKQPFNPAAIKSQFLHVFIVVHKDEWDGRSIWRVEIASVDSVPNFGPPLPDGGIFYDDSELQSFLLAKLINAEYSALKSPKFAQPLTRAREGILTNIVERGYKLAQDPDIRTVHSSRHSKSPSSSSDRSSRSSKSNPSDNNGHSHRDISPAPSRSSVIKDLSEGIVGIGRRRKNNQYPSKQGFDEIVQSYLDNLSFKKRDKALIDRQRYELILQVLQEPKNTSVSTAQFRFWVKKMFQLVSHSGRLVVCHDNKPVAMREQIYQILIWAHRQSHHGGRDKTSTLVRRRFSWIPKELIARFVRHCPFCITRRNGHAD
ncbi:uncharacterized protein BX664DRAFT_237922, partial [Halteromyces radiatus]|uniref:uncharacterized protein n=1 Tax=Halteromyces radiatus TaxID=101107 RepID=UPI00221EA6F5